ncbi:FAD:protein FMN transferase [Salinimicrobium catena]|uniref:FAD:protein FMN transferase n=1 Tax=Salinimicrobium catena TaxID=390640 RepID=UPI002FE4D965
MKKFSSFQNILILCLIGLVTSCNSGPSKQTAAGEALGTTYNITYYSEKEIALEKALDSIFERVNQSMSTYREGSDISRLNSGDSLVKVDTLFRNVFRLSEKVYNESNGYFDPTVGNLVNFYGFGPERGEQEVDTAKVDSLMQFVGLDKISLTEEGRVESSASAVYLDFNAIAKGYTIDLIGHYLDSRKVENYLVELGGELLAKGKNLEKAAAWTVGIDDPEQLEEQRTLTAAVKLKDRAMATSGNYRKNRIDPATGKMYVHTINPLTGYAEKSDVLSASVLAENCALADAYATAFMAMGLERSKEMLSKLETVDAYLIYAKEDGSMGKYATAGFEEVLVDLD